MSPGPPFKYGADLNGHERVDPPAVVAPLDRTSRPRGRSAMICDRCTISRNSAGNSTVAWSATAATQTTTTRARASTRIAAVYRTRVQWTRGAESDSGRQSTPVRRATSSTARAARALAPGSPSRARTSASSALHLAARARIGQHAQRFVGDRFRRERRPGSAPARRAGRRRGWPSRYVSTRTNGLPSR